MLRKSGVCFAAIAFAEINILIKTKKAGMRSEFKSRSSQLFFILFYWLRFILIADSEQKTGRNLPEF